MKRSDLERRLRIAGKEDAKKTGCRIITKRTDEI